MSELPIELARLLETAQSNACILPVRLRALGTLVQQIDHAFATAAKPPGSDHQARHSPSTNECGLATTEVASTFSQINQIVHNELIPLLTQQSIELGAIERLTAAQHDWLQNYFTHRIYPLLTPLAVDPGHPFPYISSDSLNYLVLLQAPATLGAGRPRLLFARVKVPRHAVPRVVILPEQQPMSPSQRPTHRLIWSADLVRYFAPELFPGMSVTGIYQFHILRASVADAHTNGTGETKQQKFSPVVRLDIEARAPKWLVRWLLEHLEITTEIVVTCAMPLEIVSLADLADYVTPLLAEPIR